MSNQNLQHKVSIYRIIGNVIGNLRLGNVNPYLDDFARWCVEAELFIGSRHSTERFECLIDVENRRACLPQNFEYEHGFNLNGRKVQVTKRDFRMFNKAARTTVVEPENFIGGNLVVVNPGVKMGRRITFQGTYTTGDTIAITISINNCGTVFPHTFTYVVVGGDTLNSIATAIATQINAIDTGVTATPSFGYIEILADNVNITFTISTYTDSAAGTMYTTLTQAHVPQTMSGTNNDNCEVSIEKGSSSLANLQAYNLNTGIFGPGNGVNDFPFGETTGAMTYSIDNGYAFFNFIDNGKIGLSYQGVCVDEKGWPMVHKTHEMAITQYCEYMYKGGEYKNGKLAEHVYDRLEKRWFWLCGQARGDDEMPSKDEMIYASNMWNQLLPLPDKNNF